MTEVRKESLSALIDGEASEIEVHRLVREFRSDSDLSVSWGVYQKIRATARRNSDPLSLEHHHILFERISASIDSEGDHDVLDTRQPSASRKQVIGGLALAASLVIAVFVGVQQPEQGTPIADASPAINTVPIAVQNVANTNMMEEGAPELIELDEEKQKRLRAYLNQHDQMSRMNPGKQFVNYSVPQKSSIERAEANQ